MFEDETPKFWSGFSQRELAERCAALSHQRRQTEESRLAGIVDTARLTVATMFVRGSSNQNLESKLTE